MSEPLHNSEYKSKLCEYDEMLTKAKQVAVLLEDINNFFAKKYELFKGKPDDSQWSDNQDLIEEQLIDQTKLIHKLCKEELQ